MFSLMRKSGWMLSCLTLLAACGQGGAPGSVNASGAAGEEAAVFGGERIESRMLISRYVAGIEYRNDQGEMQLCTAVVVGPQILVTAAHCVSKDLSSMRVYFTTSLENLDAISSSLTRRVSAARIHEKYAEALADKSRVNVYDIAVLKLDTPAPSTARHAQLAASLFPVSQIPSAYVIGFGMSSFDSRTRVTTGERTLKSVAVPRLETSQVEILRLDQTKGAGVCAGDSGSPMLVENAQGFIVMGVASTVYNANGNDSCRGDSTFISTSHYRVWIYQQAFEMLQVMR